MSLKQICFVSVFFSDDEDEPDPNIILEERTTKPQNQIKIRKRGGVTEDVLARFIVGYDILVDCWERALRSAAQMVPYEVSIGLILIVRLVSTFGSLKAIARIFPNPTRERTGGTAA
ncbi:hypothetical protein ZWY2020_015051 [Hordeum vulgare]|nr:hypothetical protein ZWY2020_015051 [Hordeum vulgare]